MQFNIAHRTHHVVLAIGALLVCACSARTPEPPPEKFVGEYLSVYPDDTLTGWASYVDQLSTVTVVAESEIPPPPEVRKHGEGYIGRKVRVRIDETLWSNGASAAQTGEIDLVVFGWVLKGEKRVPMNAVASPRIEVGGKYTLPLVKEGDQWAVLTPSSVGAAADDAVATADVHKNGNNAMARALTGASRQEVSRRLSEAPRDPMVEKYRHLPPQQRAQAIRIEQSGPPEEFGSSTPSRQRRRR